MFFCTKRELIKICIKGVYTLLRIYIKGKMQNKKAWTDVRKKGREKKSSNNLTLARRFSLSRAKASLKRMQFNFNRIEFLCF